MQCQDAHTDCCNGLDNGFCDLRLNEPLYGLVHNAMSSFEDQFFLLYNQNYKLEDALVAGYRALELDVSRCGDKNQIVFYHGECALGTRDVTEVLENVHSFLKDNPSEIIMLHLQMNNDIVSLDDFYDVMAQVDNGNLVSGLYSHPLNATEWPTLRELIQVNQRLLVFYWNSDDCAPGAGGPGCPPGFHYYYRYGVQTQWDFARLADIQDNNNNDDPDDTSSCALSYMPSYRNGHNFFRVNAFLRIPSSSAAKDVLNQPFFMQERLDACSMQNPIVKNGTVSVQVPAASQEEKFFLPPNFYAVDFWEKGNVMQFIQEYNIKLLQDKAANLLDNTNFGNTVVVDESSPPEEYDATANATDYGATDLDSLISDVTNGDGGRDRRRGQRRQRLRRQL